jgi:ABC-type polysaccharide/polyol phosphate transport system ATPase subunit
VSEKRKAATAACSFKLSTKLHLRVESAKNITKAYQIYDKPQDRLKQSLWRGRKQFYRECKALDDVSFEVKKGETVGIVGRNDRFH